MAESPEFDMGSMDDLGMPDQPSVAEAPTVPVEAPETPVEAPAAAVADEVPFEDLPAYWQEEITRKRESEARYRTRAQQYEQAFDGYDDDTRQQLLTYFQLAKRAEAGDQQAAQELTEWLGDDDNADDVEDNFPQTREEYEAFVREAARDEAQRLYEERTSHQQKQDMIEGVVQRAEALGYKFGTRPYKMLLDIAVNDIDAEEGVDILAAAHEQYQAEMRELAAAHQGDYLAKKEADAASAPRVATPGSSPNLASGPPKSFAEARARMDERLANT
jgi:hypothetical protein